MVLGSVIRRYRGGLIVQSGVLQVVRVLSLRGVSRGSRGVIQGSTGAGYNRCDYGTNVNSGMFPRVTQG